MAQVRVSLGEGQPQIELAEMLGPPSAVGLVRVRLHRGGSEQASRIVLLRRGG